MRAVVQRVKRAEVTVDHTPVSSINKGFLILLGIRIDDTLEDVLWLAKKIGSMRIMSDDYGLMNLSLKDVSGSALVVSQFTLHASTKKGNRPGFTEAARPEQAIPLYEMFKKILQEEGIEDVQSGIFGAMMDISLINDGPVTIIIDSKNKE
jgi:D-tyrosyl-tRNA(Tyr) deacylase